jgi:diaminopimelate decarboxylase
MPERFVYGVLLDLVLCRAADAEPHGPVTIAGHINEGNDLFAQDLPFPPVEEGDVVAAINVGSYNASMTSEHCLRPAAKAIAFRDRAAGATRT